MERWLEGVGPVGLVGLAGDSSGVLVQRLRDFYGLLPQPPSDPFQFFIWEILSADALPARRDLAWHALRRIPALTPDAMARTPQKELLEITRMIGPHPDERIERIRATTGEMKRHREVFDPDNLRTRGLKSAARAFRRLSHFPREALDRALLYAAGYPVLPLDDGGARVVARMEGIATTPGELRSVRRRARKRLASSLPCDLDGYRDAVLYLRHHAQNTCLVVAPHCKVCPLLSDCELGRTLA